MRPEERDNAYLWDMREAARDCQEFTQDTTYDEFCANRMMYSAVERRLEILGEATGKVSDYFKPPIQRYLGRKSKAFAWSWLTGMAISIFMNSGNR